ncbi:MAG TPA: pantoate--beta-alanine ligase [Rhodospirillales bacterium]|nr:pantoate--beta-alanine ligase [Rhodospirillales bacterium]
MSAETTEMQAAGLTTVRTVHSLRAQLRRWRQDGDLLALVPTMGALHDGHLALVRHARGIAERVCVSLFVNPTQFGPNEDFAVYPRDEAGDAAKLQALGADLLFAPPVDEMYPPGALTRVSVPSLGDMLEGEHRPGFFTGVATVVNKLLLQALPDIAVFGEKDYQQLLVVRRMCTDLWIPTRIEGAPTVREADGLALSSRNAYLSADQRRIAPGLHRTLREVADGLRDGVDPIEPAAWGEAELLRAGFDAVDYVAVRDAETLFPWSGPSRPGRVLAAARLGRTRLIDNVAVV